LIIFKNLQVGLIRVTPCTRYKHGGSLVGFQKHI